MQVEDDAIVKLGNECEERKSVGNVHVVSNMICKYY